VFVMCSFKYTEQEGSMRGEGNGGFVLVGHSTSFGWERAMEALLWWETVRHSADSLVRNTFH
jgi:hypothetical protein